MTVAPTAITTGSITMKPNDFIFNSDMQSLSNSTSGEVTFSVSNGQIVTENTLIDYRIVKVPSPNAVLRMAIEMRDYDSGIWWPSRSYAAFVQGHSADSGYLTNGVILDFSAHRISNDEICFVMCAFAELGNYRIQIDQDRTFRIKYRLLTQPV